MVNTAREASSQVLDQAARLVWLYVAIVVATLGALVVLVAMGSDQATQEAWVHAVIVGVFALVLPLRLRAARAGSRRALIAVGIIAIVLVVVNVAEALIPGLFPIWMRVEMIGIAALMAVLAVLVLRARR